MRNWVTIYKNLESMRELIGKGVCPIPITNKPYYYSLFLSKYYTTTLYLCVIVGPTTSMVTLGIQLINLRV